jgi:hypothetical protein
MNHAEQISSLINKSNETASPGGNISKKAKTLKAMSKKLKDLGDSDNLTKEQINKL